jgi:hypothetical protein
MSGNTNVKNVLGTGAVLIATLDIDMDLGMGTANKMDTDKYSRSKYFDAN